MNKEKLKTRLWNGSVKAGLGAIAVSVIGWMGYAMLWDEPVLPVQLEVEKRVTLLPAKSELTPKATFRVRFEKPMVAAEVVGAEDADNPLVFNPPLKGTFIWDSTRSGNFVPADAFPVDVKYTVTVQPELAKANGLKLWRKFQTPSMRLESGASFHLPSERLFSDILRFNVEVDPKKAEAFIEFRSDDGQVIPARVKTPKNFSKILTAPLPPLPPAVSPTTGLPTLPSSREDEPEPETRDETRLLVESARLLPGGVKWQLVLRKGLPSADGKHQFAHEEKFNLGMRKPMNVTGAHTENRLNFGRSIHVNFSRALPRDAKDSELGKWLTVEEKIDGKFSPTKVEHSITAAWRSVAIKGEFELGQTYRVRVKPGLPSKLGLKLAKEWSDMVKFRPLPSRVFLPRCRRSNRRSATRLERHLDLAQGAPAELRPHPGPRGVRAYLPPEGANRPNGEGGIYLGRRAGRRPTRAAVCFPRVRGHGRLGQ